jgi:hypothetical protein
MVKAHRKMQKFSEIQYHNRNKGEYVLALKSTNQNNKPVFIHKIRLSDDTYKYKVGNKEISWKIREHKNMDDAKSDLKHFIDANDKDLMIEAVNKAEKLVKKPEGKKLYNLNDF